MIPAKCLDEMSETDFAQLNYQDTRSTLAKFERAKILEIYFSRLDGRKPEFVPEEFESLYRIELGEIKNFLLGQHPQDAILQRILKVMS